MVAKEGQDSREALDQLLKSTGLEMGCSAPSVKRWLNSGVTVNDAIGVVSEYLAGTRGMRVNPNTGAMDFYLK